MIFLLCNKGEREREMYEEVRVLEHSSIKITGEKTIYFDPFHISEERNDADIIFVTHEHYDHFSPEDIRKVRKDDTCLVLPKSMEGQEKKADFAKEKVTFLAPGETCRIGEISVEGVAAYNKRKPFHTKGKGWLGYVVTMNGTRYFVAGDTDANEENRNVQCDVAIVPIGGTYTMDAKAAAQLVNEIKPKAAIPSHYGSIVGTDKDAGLFAEKVDNGIATRR